MEGVRRKWCWQPANNRSTSGERKKNKKIKIKGKRENGEKWGKGRWCAEDG